MTNLQIPVLLQEKFNPVLLIKSKFFVVIAHAWYSWPESTVIFGNVATYSKIPELAVAAVVASGDRELRLEERDRNVSNSKSLTLDSSPSFTVTIATTSPFVLFTPNIVIMTLNISAPVPPCAWIGFFALVMFIIDTDNARVRLKIDILVVTVVFLVGILFPLQ